VSIRAKLRELNPDEPDTIRDGYIWFHDYRNYNIQYAATCLGIKTWGDLADTTPNELIKAGLIPDEVGEVKVILGERGLLLNKDKENEDE